MFKPWDRTGRVYLAYKNSDSGTPARIITEDTVAAGETAVAEWNNYVARLKPLETKVVKDKFGSEAELKTKTKALQTDLRGKAGADLAKAATTLPKVSGNVSKGIATRAVAGTDIATRAAQAATEVTDKATGRKANELQAIVGIGRGQQVDNLAAMNSIGASSAQAAITAAKADQAERFANDAATMQMVGSAAKAGMAGYGAYNSNSTIPDSPTNYNLGREVAPTATSGGYSQSTQYPVFDILAGYKKGG